MILQTGRRYDLFIGAAGIRARGRREEEPSHYFWRRIRQPAITGKEPKTPPNCQDSVIFPTAGLSSADAAAALRQQRWQLFSYLATPIRVTADFSAFFTNFSPSFALHPPPPLPPHTYLPLISFSQLAGLSQFCDLHNFLYICNLN